MRQDLDPDPEMWNALDEGRLLRVILESFYDKVYEDERMRHFFVNTTKSRAIDKQFEFLRDKFLGTRDYFGDRPRNAHHWMVIDNDLFDYRETLLAQCAREAGLPEPFIARWTRLDGRFRKQIVKSAPIAKKVRGVSIPFEGYESLTMSAASVCDGCQEEVPSGSEVRYHVRTGATYCASCASTVDAQ